MAEQQHKKVEAKKPGPWKVSAPNRGLDRWHTPYRLRFVNGDVETSDPKAAAHCVDCGYEVTDLASGEITNPLPATVQRLEAEAAEADAKRAATAPKK